MATGRDRTWVRLEVMVFSSLYRCLRQMNHSSASYQVWHLAGLTFDSACPSWTVDLSKFNVECCDEEKRFCFVFLFMTFLVYDSIIYFVLLQRCNSSNCAWKVARGSKPWNTNIISDTGLKLSCGKKKETFNVHLLNE